MSTAEPAPGTVPAEAISKFPDASILTPSQKRIYDEFRLFPKPEQILDFVLKARTAGIPESLISVKRDQELGSYLYERYLNADTINPQAVAAILNQFGLTNESVVFIAQEWIGQLRGYIEKIKRVISVMGLTHEELNPVARKWLEKSYRQQLEVWDESRLFPNMSELSELGITPEVAQLLIEDIVCQDLSPKSIDDKIKNAHNFLSYDILNHIAHAKRFVDDKLHLSPVPFFGSEKIGLAVDRAILHSHSQYEQKIDQATYTISRLKSMPDGYKILDPQLLEQVRIGFKQKFTKTNLRHQNITAILNEVAGLEKVLDYTQFLPSALRSMLHNFNLDLSNLSALSGPYADYLDYLMTSPDQPALFLKADEHEILRLRITLDEAELLKRNGENLSEIKEEIDYEKMFSILISKHQIWQDEQSIGNPFKSGAEAFGYRRMFAYVDRRQVDQETHRPTLALELTRHDALHSFEDILALYRASQMTANLFWGNILNQVRMDDSSYDEGNAHQHFNAIAATTNRDVGSVVARVQRYRDITRLQELAALFKTSQQVFASWQNLKRYSELTQVLERAEILDELQELKTQGKDKLYDYVEALAFHPASKVDMQAVIQFWRDPQSFLESVASHTPEEVHSRKKPSNYITMPNLDLTAEELRDALVEGKMDGLQAFSALEITYVVQTGGRAESLSLRETMKTALGSRKLGVAGAAKSANRLFKELNAVLKESGLTVQAYLEGSESPEVQRIEDLLYHPEYGMVRPSVATQKYVARINLKSDPEGVLAGNDTANCMPFGDGKTTVYTFNPNTALFLLQLLAKDGTARTITQSVLTKDMDIRTPVPEVLEKLQLGGRLEQVLPENVVSGADAYVACDNIEGAPNYVELHKSVIEAIYRDFFREYVNRFGTAQRLVKDKVVIGQGYADALTHLPEAPNTYVPQAPVSYSDKTGDKVFVLDLTMDDDNELFLTKTTRVVEPEESFQNLPSLPRGLSYLTFEDAVRVGYLEGKAYSDNQSLMQYLHNMENALIAKDINNAAKGRPNMSIKYTDANEKMRGYFLAYEGVLNDEYIAQTEMGYAFFDKPVLYLLDLASDRESRMTGGRLIHCFVDLYRQNYLEQGKLLPLFMQAREQTSFRIIQRQLEKICEVLGVEFELIVLPPYPEGGDTMYPVIINPRRMQL